MELQPLACNDAATTLDSLPPDIIRIILPMNGHPMEKLQLISPVWNIVVRDHMAIRKNLPPLKFVRFYKKLSMNYARVAYLIVYVERLAFYSFDDRKTADCQRLRWMFEKCSAIEALNLDDIPDLNTLSAVLRSMKGVPIRTLFSHDSGFNSASREKIILIAEYLQIETIILCMDTFDLNNLRILFRKVTETTKELLIFEQDWTTRNRKFWEQIARELNDEPFTVQVMNGEYRKLAENSRLRLRITA